MDDNDAKSTGGKYRIIPILEKAAKMAAATKGLNVMVGSGVDGSTFPHGTQGLEFESLVKKAIELAKSDIALGLPGYLGPVD